MDKEKSVSTNFHENVFPSPLYNFPIFDPISETLSFNEPHTPTSSYTSSNISAERAAAAEAAAAAAAATASTTMSSSIMTTTDSEQPYFDFELQRNVTVTVGQTGFLHCRVERLGDKDVSKWLKWFYTLHSFFLALSIRFYVRLDWVFSLVRPIQHRIFPCLRLNEAKQSRTHCASHTNRNRNQNRFHLTTMIKESNRECMVNG